MIIAIHSHTVQHLSALLLLLPSACARFRLPNRIQIGLFRIHFGLFSFFRIRKACPKNLKQYLLRFACFGEWDTRVLLPLLRPLPVTPRIGESSMNRHKRPKTKKKTTINWTTWSLPSELERRKVSQTFLVRWGRREEGCRQFPHKMAQISRWNAFPFLWRDFDDHFLWRLH